MMFAKSKLSRESLDNSYSSKSISPNVLNVLNASPATSQINIQDEIRHTILGKLAHAIKGQDSEKIYARLLKKCDFEEYFQIFKNYMKYEKASIFAKEIYDQMSKAVKKSSFKDRSKIIAMKKIQKAIGEEEDSERVYNEVMDQQSEKQISRVLSHYVGSKIADPLAKDLFELKKQTSKIKDSAPYAPSDDQNTPGYEITKATVIQKLKNNIKEFNSSEIYQKLLKPVSLQGFTNILREYVGKNKLDKLAKELFYDIQQIKKQSPSEEETKMIEMINKYIPEENSENILRRLQECFELSDVLEVLQVYHGKKKAEELGPLFLEEVKKYQKKHGSAIKQRTVELMKQKLRGIFDDEDPEDVFDQLEKEANSFANFQQILCRLGGKLIGLKHSKQLFSMMAKIAKIGESCPKLKRESELMLTPCCQADEKDIILQKLKKLRTRESADWLYQQLQRNYPNYESFVRLFQTKMSQIEAEELGKELYYKMAKIKDKTLKKKDIEALVYEILNKNSNFNPYPTTKIFEDLYHVMIYQITTDIKQYFRGYLRGMSSITVQTLFILMTKLKLLQTKYSKQNVNTIQNLYKQLEKEGLPYQKINEIQKYVTTGKKYRLKRELINTLGPYKSQKLLKEYSEFILQKIRYPYERSVKIGQQKGLDIYEYPMDTVPERQKNHAKTLVVLGQTGSGKSTFLNAAVNYLEDIEVNDSFRYHICLEDKNMSKIDSNTKDIKISYAKNVRNGDVYRIIDTPGFGDTVGIQEDKKNVINIHNLFKTKINEIHCVLFVLKCSTNRITHFQQYVFQSVLDLFGKDIAKQVVFVFTFSDSGEPLVLNVVKDSDRGFGKYWDLIEQPKYIQVNNSGIFQQIDPNDSIMSAYWQIGISKIDKLFQKIRHLQGNSLSMTREMINKKQHYILRMKKAQELFQNSLIMQQKVQNHMETIIYSSEEINNNKNYEYEEEVEEFYSENINKNVTRCQTCMNTNCHINCYFGQGQTKKKCCAFDHDGNCTICSGKCSYMNHYNSKQIRRARKIKIKQTNLLLQKKYNIANNEKNIAEKTLIQMFKEMDAAIEETARHAEEILKMEAELNKICLTDKKQETTVEYLKYLITEERKSKRSGWEKRIDIFNNNIKEYEIIEFYSKGGVQKKRDQMLKEIREARNQNIINTVDPNYWDRLKPFLQ